MVMSGIAHCGAQLERVHWDLGTQELQRLFEHWATLDTLQGGRDKQGDV